MLRRFINHAARSRWRPRRGLATAAAAPAESNSGKRTLGDVDTAGLHGATVLVRADLNAPLDKEDPTKITDDTRVRAVLPTVRHLAAAGARVVLCSHLGRPKGAPNDAMRLAPVAARLAELLAADGVAVASAPDCVGADVRARADALEPGAVLVLENLRFHAGEEANDAGFAAALARAAGGPALYVNDAFRTAHRAHASTAGVTAHVDGPRVAGFLLEKELRFLQGSVSDAPARPLAAVIGGAKVSTKLPVLESLIDKCDALLLGGGMIFTFYKARGLPVGDSLVEDEQVGLARALEAKARAKGVALLLPEDVVAADAFDADAACATVAMGGGGDGGGGIPDGKIGLDIGPRSVARIQEELAGCATVLWNGPMGVFEFPRFARGTFAVAECLAELSERHGATTVIGGGDSVAAVEQSGLAGKMSHISTGGGASLELLEGKVLPGVAALDDA